MDTDNGKRLARGLTVAPGVALACWAVLVGLHYVHIGYDPRPPYHLGALWLVEGGKLRLMFQPWRSPWVALEFWFQYAILTALALTIVFLIMSIVSRLRSIGSLMVAAALIIWALVSAVAWLLPGESAIDQLSVPIGPGIHVLREDFDIALGVVGAAVIWCFVSQAVVILLRPSSTGLTPSGLLVMLVDKARKHHR